MRPAFLVPGVLTAVLLSLTAARATEFDPAKLALVRARMQRFVEEKQLAGVVTVIGSSKGVASLEALGSLEGFDTNQVMPADGLFRIASMTKPITALAVLMLVGAGKLDVNDPVEKHLPEFRGQLLVAERDKDRMVLKKPSRPITLRDLLTHTSGLPAYPPGLSDVYVKRNRTLAEATLAVAQRPLDFEPGTRWAYCNSGIDTLGRVVEVVSGQRFEDFLKTRIFDPLGMKDTTFYPDRAQMKRLAGLYGQKEGKLFTAPLALIGPPEGAKHPIPAGGLYSTAADMAKFYQMTLNGGALAGKRIISTDLLRAMTKVQTNELKSGFTSGMGFGYGFAVVRKPEGVTAMLSEGSFGHGGAFGTQSWADPKRDLFVVLMIQRVGLKNADASEMRGVLQRIAVDAIKK